MNAEEQQARPTDAPVAGGRTPRKPWARALRDGLVALNWRTTALVAAAMALVWCVMMFSSSTLQLMAGIVPLAAGLYLGGKVKEHHLLHGLMLGLLAFVFGLLMTLAYAGIAATGSVPLPPTLAADLRTPTGMVLFFLGFSPFAMIPFPAFGTVTAARNQQRAKEMRKEVDDRGGRLERYSRVADLSDLQGLSLPQFGKYVADLFKRQGFELTDFRFVDKDKHLDLFLAHKGESWMLRLAVADKVRPGTVETLAQEMRQRQVNRGLAVTSTEFTPDAVKAAKGKRQVLLIDGETLLGMGE